MEAQVDRLDGKALEARYGKGRTTILAWCKALGIEPATEGRRAVYTLDQVQQLDDLNDYLTGGKGRTLGEYVTRFAIADKSPTDMPTVEPDLDTPPGHATARPEVPPVIARVMRLRALLEAVRFDFPLTSSEVSDAIGCPCSTHLQSFEGRGFRFSRVGREGREYLWRVARAEGYIAQVSEPVRELISQGNGNGRH